MNDMLHLTVAAPMLRAAGADDVDAILRLLDAAGLPTADLTPDRWPAFIVAAGEGGALLGAVAIERYGPHGLLRSLAVAPAQRGRGVGARLLAAVQAQARADGLATLSLLTDSAAPYFAARGWRRVARAEAPAAVQASTQFAQLCPASSACLTRSLHDIDAP